jgi:hypothetical protein
MENLEGSARRLSPKPTDGEPPKFLAGGGWRTHGKTLDVCGTRGENPRRWKKVAQGSLSSLAAFPPRRDFGGADSHYLYPVLDS